jgi:hypothetical protein
MNFQIETKAEIQEQVSKKGEAAQRPTAPDAFGSGEPGTLAIYLSRKEGVLLSFPHESVVAFARAP